MLHRTAMALAVTMLSPVTILTVTPAPLNLFYSTRHFRSYNVHNTQNANQSETTSFNVLDILIYGLVMFSSTFILLYVFVSQTDSSERLSGVVIDNLIEFAIHFILDFFYLAVFVKIMMSSNFLRFQKLLCICSLLP
jgi:hypothetical protein